MLLFLPQTLLLENVVFQNDQDPARDFRDRLAQKGLSVLEFFNGLSI